MAVADCFSLICHRLPEKTFGLDGRLLPLCSRCTGIYAGFLISFIFLAVTAKRRAGFPPPSITLTALIFIGLLLFHSAASPAFFPETNQWRFVTGIFGGGSIGLFLFPVWNEYLLKRTTGKPVVPDWRSYLCLLGILSVISLLPFSGALENPPVFRLLGSLSAAGAFAVYLAVNTFLAALFSGWKNRKGFLPALARLVMLVLVFFLLEFLLFRFNPLKSLF